MMSWLSSNTSQGGWMLPWRSLLLSAAALLWFLLAGPAPEAWVYDRQAIAAGEYWRLLSGHLVHGDGSHALWDIIALLLLGGLFEGRLRSAFCWVMLASLLAIDAWLWWGMPGLIRYCGLSGVLNGVLAAGLWAFWRERSDPLVLLVAGGTLGKVFLEMFSGHAIFTDTLWPSLPEVHMIGLLAGWLCVFLLHIFRSQYPAYRCLFVALCRTNRAGTHSNGNLTR